VGPEPTGGAVVVAAVVVVVVVVVVAGLLILMVGPPLPVQATVNDKTAMLVAMAKKAARRMIRSFTSHPPSRGLSIAIKDSPALRASGKAADTSDGSGLAWQGWSGCLTVICVNGGLTGA
jgi:hypothetical protein